MTVVLFYFWDFAIVIDRDSKEGEKIIGQTQTEASKLWHPNEYQDST